MQNSEHSALLHTGFEPKKQRDFSWVKQQQRHGEHARGVVIQGTKKSAVGKFSKCCCYSLVQK